MPYLSHNGSARKQPFTMDAQLGSVRNQNKNKDFLFIFVPVLIWSNIVSTFLKRIVFKSYFHKTIDRECQLQ